VLGSLLQNRAVIAQLVQREIVGRYRGSFLGLLWSFLNPLLMLTIYTFVFGVVFKSRWRPEATDTMEYAVVMFAGVMLQRIRLRQDQGVPEWEGPDATMGSEAPRPAS